MAAIGWKPGRVEFKCACCKKVVWLDPVARDLYYDGHSLCMSCRVLPVQEKTGLAK